MNPNCVFAACELPGRYRCRRCGFLAPPTHWPPERIYKTCILPAPWYTFGHRGLGDTLAAIIHRVTLGYVTPCAACNSRRAWLNRHLPYPLKGAHLWALTQLAIKRLRGAICRSLT